VFIDGAYTKIHQHSLLVAFEITGRKIHDCATASRLTAQLPAEVIIANKNPNR
jgi:hypothetical protein